MTRDLATVQQGIEQLKASQDQMARDNTKVAEQNLRPKTSAPPPRSVGAQTPVSSTLQQATPSTYEMTVPKNG